MDSRSERVASLSRGSRGTRLEGIGTTPTIAQSKDERMFLAAKEVVTLITTEMSLKQ